MNTYFRLSFPYSPLRSCTYRGTFPGSNDTWQDKSCREKRHYHHCWQIMSTWNRLFVSSVLKPDFPRNNSSPTFIHYGKLSTCSLAEWWPCGTLIYSRNQYRPLQLETPTVTFNTLKRHLQWKVKARKTINLTIIRCRRRRSITETMYPLLYFVLFLIA